MSVLKKLVGQTAIYGIPSVVGRLLNYLLVPIHTYYFLPEKFGVVTELYAYIAFIMVVLLYGMETAYFRFAQKFDEKKVFHSIQTGLVFTTGIFWLGTYFYAESIAIALGYAGFPQYIRWMSLIMAFDTLSAVPLARLRHREKPVKFMTINVTNILANIGLNLFFFLYWTKSYRDGAEGFILQNWFDPDLGVGYIFLANVFASGLRFLLNLFHGFPNPIQFDFGIWKKSLAYSWPLVLTGMAGIVNETADRAILKNILSPKIGTEAALYQLGVYGACYKLSIIVSICIQAFRYAAEPLFFKQLKGRSDETMIQIMNYLTGFILLIFIVVSLFMDVFKHFIQNEAYWEGLGIVPLLLLANCFLGMHIQISMWYKLSDKTQYGAIIAGIAAVLTLAGNFILVPWLGYWGAAVTTLVVYMYLPVSSFLFSRKHYFIPYQIKKIGILLLVSIAMVAWGYYLQSDIHFAVKGIMILVYLTIFYFLEKKFHAKAQRRKENTV